MRRKHTSVSRSRRDSESIRNAKHKGASGSIIKHLISRRIRIRTRTSTRTRTKTRTSTRTSTITIASSPNTSTTTS